METTQIKKSWKITTSKHGNEIHNPEEMNKYLETYSLPRLKQENRKTE